MDVVTPKWSNEVVPVTKHTIELDDATAATLDARAAERGVTVPQLIAELVALEIRPAAMDDELVAELDRRWQMTRSGSEAVSNEEVARWLATWGTPAFKSWRER
jgi:predicted transcriptional regulator